MRVTHTQVLDKYPYSFCDSYAPRKDVSMDRTYAGGPVDYNGAEFPVSNGRICGSGGVFLSDRSTSCEMLALESLSLAVPPLCVHRFPPRQAATDPGQHRGACPQRYAVRGHYSPPRASTVVFGVHCCQFFVEDPGSCAKTQVLTSIKCHCHFSESFLW